MPADKFRLSALLFLLWLSAAAGTARAEVVEERLALAETSRRAWIVVFESNHTVLLEAQTRREGRSLVLRAEIENLPARALLGGVVQLLDGRIVSSALRRADEVWTDAGWLTPGQSLEEQERRIAEAGGRIEKLESEIDAVQIELRRKAGLEDVAANLEQISALRRKLKKLREIEQSLKKAEELISVITQ